MQRRQFFSLLWGLAALPWINRAWVSSFIKSAEDIREIYRNSVVIDCLATPGSFNVRWPPRGPLSEVQLQNAARSGITAVNVTVSSRDFEQTVRNIALWQGEIDKYPAQLLHVKKPYDIDHAKQTERLGLIFGFQTPESIDRDLTLLGVFYKLGVRIIQLTYNTRNLLGDGCLEQGGGGLTQLGRDAVAEMNELGIAVDLSHCNPQTTADGIAVSSKPVIISHSGCCEVYRHPRNKEDSALRAMSERGGVIGIFMIMYLGNDGTPYANQEMLLDHIDHAVNVCGADHVGIGSDLSITPVEETTEYLNAWKELEAQRAKLGIQAPDESGRIPYIPKLNTPRRIEEIALALSRRGHSENVIEKIIGGNFKRVFSEIWQA